MDTQPTDNELEPLVSLKELAGYLGVPVSTVHDWRSNGAGPLGYRFGERVMFAISDIQAWMETMRDPASPVGGPSVGERGASFRG